MRVRDVLAAVTAAILDQRRILQLDSKVFDLVPMPGDRWCLSLPGITIESVSPNERTLVGQAVKNFGRIVLRVRKKNQTGQYEVVKFGAIDGRYVDDVELEITKLVFAGAVSV